MDSSAATYVGVYIFIVVWDMGLVLSTIKERVIDIWM